MKTAVVVPTYEEAMNIGDIVRRIRSSLPEADVVVVDDNSPDGTAKVAEATGKDVGHVHVIVRAGREGLGPAYREGWSWAIDQGYEAIVSMDADGSHDPAVLPTLVAGLEEGADLVMGSRYVPGGAVPGWPLRRLMLSRYGSRYASVVLGLPIHDATGGYRAYRASLLRRIDVSTLRANGYGFQIELVHRGTRLGAKIVEVPITFVDRRLGTSKMHAGIVFEALWLVTWWGIRDRVLRRGANRRRGSEGHGRTR
jgi:dolichol-phosphate mannosyltransferase